MLDVPSGKGDPDMRAQTKVSKSIQSCTTHSLSEYVTSGEYHLPLYSNIHGDADTGGKYSQG
jgi:hypothetical protein